MNAVNDNGTCDICKNVYCCGNIYNGIFLETSIFYIIRVKSMTCLSVNLWITGYGSESYPQRVKLTFNSTMFRMPVLSSTARASLYTTMCNIEIPLIGVLSRSWKDPELMASAHDVTDVFWGGVLYRRLSRRIAVTWETAALSCQEIGGSLLTIQSSAEYQFIKDTFLQTSDVAILYVGVMREVMCILLLHIHTIPSKC